MARMIDLLIGQREWPVLDAMATGRLTLSQAWDSWRKDPTLRSLLESLRDVDASAYVDGWQKWIGGQVAERTALRYLRGVRLLVPAGETATPLSSLTRRRMMEVLTTLAGEPARAQYARAAWISFFEYLRLADVVPHNLARDVPLPSATKARERWLTIEDSIKLVDAQPEPYNVIAAIREGACAETQAAIAVSRGDCNSNGRFIHLHGTKNGYRDRISQADKWAWERIEPYLSSRGDGDRLFPDADYWQVRKEHVRACQRLGIADYRPHDARHSYCVRHMKAGTRIELITQNGGWRDATMLLSRYGKYRVTAADYQEVDPWWK